VSATNPNQYRERLTHRTEKWRIRGDREEIEKILPAELEIGVQVYIRQRAIRSPSRKERGSSGQEKEG